MGRPKGSLNKKRDKSKYYLPDGVVLIDTINSPHFDMSTKLKFLDSKYGEFISTFTALKCAQASTHPLAVNERRKTTNLQKYGCTFTVGNPEIRQKMKQTLLDNYGVDNPLKSPELREKSQQTCLKNFGVKWSSQSPIVREKIMKSVQEHYGVDHISKSLEIQKKIQETNLKKYGVTNVSKSPKIVDKIMESRIKSQLGRNSKQEKELMEYIKSLGFSDAKKSYLGGSGPRELDVLIPSLNVAFELNGCYYHSEAKKEDYRTCHIEKMKKAQKKGIKLIQIWDHEWDKRRPQVKSFIRSLLGKNEIRIYARNCELKEVSKLEAKKFLERYHIQGASFIYKVYGLYYNNELLCLASIGKHHRGKAEWVLNRYVGKTNITVVGGLSRLSKHLRRTFGEIFTWIDLRLSTGDAWIDLGWEKINESKPDYFYYNTKNAKVVSKQSRQKKLVGTPEDMTEHEHAKQDGLYQVYDCGKIKLKY